MNTKTKLFALTLAACLSGLGALAYGSPQFGETSGYHDNEAKPNSQDSGSLDRSCREEELLAESLKSIKGGKLSEAESALSTLVRINPQEPRYPQLLALVRRQMATESWYRYQKQFGLSWASR